jgi:hypothetical protein
MRFSETPTRNRSEFPKWRDEGKAFFEIKSDFEEKAFFFGVLLLKAHPQRDQ